MFRDGSPVQRLRRLWNLVLILLVRVNNPSVSFPYLVCHKVEPRADAVTRR